MNRKTAIIIALQTFIIIVLFWVLVFYGKDEYEAAMGESAEEIATPSHVTTENGAPTIALSVESQLQSGIVATALQPATHQSAVSSFGVVVAIDTLVELRTRYLAALSEANIVRASIANSRQEYQRLVQLNRDNRNVSDRAVAIAEAALKSDEAKLAAAETAAASIRDTMRQQWGDALTKRATQSGSESLQRLLQYQDVLVQVTLPFDTPTPDSHVPLLIAPTGAQDKTIPATFLSASPLTDSTIQGKTFYYLAPAANLRAGMRVTTRLAARDRATSGVIVPHTAVVWFANKAWAYHKQGTEKFVRTQINTDNESGDGWFNATGLKPGDEVVTSGAQLLLSEEFKYQIKNENED